MFNQAATLPGLQTATLNSATFTTGSSSASIATIDNNPNQSETTTLTVVGSAGTGSTTNTGTLTLGSANASGVSSVSGNGSGTVTVTGTLAGVNAAINGLKYTPGPGYFGTTTLQVKDTNSGTGLFLSEVMLGANSDASTAENVIPSFDQYIEIYSTAPNVAVKTLTQVPRKE